MYLFLKGNRILDAYGHLSARHPTDPTIFIMPRSTAPANVSSHRDLVQYRVADGSPVDPDAPRGYLERFIHSEIYRRFPEINGVVHSHASEVIPYANTAVPLRPCIHMAGFLGESGLAWHLSEALSRLNFLVYRQSSADIRHFQTLRLGRHSRPSDSKCQARR